NTLLENQQHIMHDLKNRRDAVSGVNVDDEMIVLLQARMLHQGAIKYITSKNEILTDLAQLL
ncbi:MAG: hypothetical protein ACTSX8_08855, partial [Alphaproteobacteria bacterium]